MRFWIPEGVFAVKTVSLTHAAGAMEVNSRTMLHGQGWGRGWQSNVIYFKEAGS